MKKIYFGLFHTLGDIVVSTAIVREIKVKYPDSEITYAVSKEYVEVLKNNPDVATIIGCDSHWEVILRSQELKYDKVYLCLQKNALDSVWHQQPEWVEENGENHNLVDFYAKRCNDDIKITNRKTYIYPQENHWLEIIEKIPAEFRDLFQKTPYITVHVQTRNPSKDWPLERFQELCTRLRNAYKGNVAIYQVGGQDDPQIGDTIVSSMLGLPIMNSAALIKNSLLQIDLDSGTSFISDSLDVPTICIMAATWSKTSGPIGPNTTFIEPSVRECIGNGLYTPCHTHCLIKPRECKYNVSVDDVFNVAVEKINARLKEKGLI